MHMPPLTTQVKEKGKEEWVVMPTLNPGDRPASISDFKTGKREVYIFACADDDSHSKIHKLRGGIDMEVGDVRVISSAEPFDFAEILRKGESYELETATSNGRNLIFKFTHI